MKELGYRLNLDAPRECEHYLSTAGRLLNNERVECLEVAGEGNMNVVVRVITSQRSFILKQSLPWVRKFPSVTAPQDRILVEAEFYRNVRANELLRQFTPEMLWLDRESGILAMEDLGESRDLMGIYRKGIEVGKQDMTDIARVVSELHFHFQDRSVGTVFCNREMRELNHAHIFELPLLEQNGFELNGVLSGLDEATVHFRKNDRLKEYAKQLGEVYLSDAGSRLLHGDYYPGSWLKTDDGFKMIDPEFCFFGPPEFELAVAVAHLKMAQQPDALIKDLFVYYHFDDRFDGELFSKFVGMEMVRRMIGLAQLPLDLNLKERLALLDEAYELITN